MKSNGGNMKKAWFGFGMTITQSRRVLCNGIIAGVCFWALAQANAAALFEDLTPGVAAGSTYTFDGQLGGASYVTNQYFVGSTWITDSVNPHWAQYSFGGSKYVGYVLLGGNGGRVPDFNQIQYTTDPSPGPGSSWITVGSIPPEGGNGMNYLAVDKVATAIRVYMEKTSAPNPYTELEAFRVYGNSDLTTVGKMNTNDSATVLGQATISLVGTWENNLGAMSVMTHLTNTLVGGSVFRGNGNLATKPELKLTWASNQLLSGVDLANVTWSGSAGSGVIYDMHVDALPKNLDPALATPSDWVTVATYSSSYAASHLIHLQFDNGSLQTRGLRLVITSVGISGYGTSRDGGDISELILVGGELRLRGSVLSLQ